MGTNKGLRASVLIGATTAALVAASVQAAATEPNVAPQVYSSSPPILYSATIPGFITRSGATLLLNGKPFKFVGLNIYNAANLGQCWYPLGTSRAIDQTLQTIGPVQNTFRTWFFQSLATRNGQRDWSTFDATLAAARAHDLRVIATLGNENPDCEGPAPAPRTEAWYAGGYAAAPDAGMPSTYRQWVNEVVARYRDNPTIVAWQLMNEAGDPTPSGRCSATAPQTLKRFVEDMAGLVKRIDPNHLLSLGSWGLTDCGLSGSAYQDIHAVAGIDLCEVHDYSGPSTALPALMQLRIAQCRALNKPLFVGEIGVRVQDAGSLAGRASFLKAKLSAQFAAGVAGALVWDWADAAEVPYSGFEIQPGDPALQILSGSL